MHKITQYWLQLKCKLNEWHRINRNKNLLFKLMEKWVWNIMKSVKKSKYRNCGGWRGNYYSLKLWCLDYQSSLSLLGGPCVWCINQLVRSLIVMANTNCRCFKYPVTIKQFNVFYLKKNPSNTLKSTLYDFKLFSKSIFQGLWSAWFKISFQFSQTVISKFCICSYVQCHESKYPIGFL